MGDFAPFSRRRRQLPPVGDAFAPIKAVPFRGKRHGVSRDERGRGFRMRAGFLPLSASSIHGKMPPAAPFSLTSEKIAEKRAPWGGVPIPRPLGTPTQRPKGRCVASRVNASFRPEGQNSEIYPEAPFKIEPTGAGLRFWVKKLPLWKPKATGCGGGSRMGDVMGTGASGCAAIWAWRVTLPPFRQPCG